MEELKVTLWQFRSGRKTAIPLTKANINTRTSREKLWTCQLEVCELRKINTCPTYNHFAIISGCSSQVLVVSTLCWLWRLILATDLWISAGSLFHYYGYWAAFLVVPGERATIISHAGSNHTVARPVASGYLTRDRDGTVTWLHNKNMYR